MSLSNVALKAIVHLTAMSHSLAKSAQGIFPCLTKCHVSAHSYF